MEGGREGKFHVQRRAGDHESSNRGREEGRERRKFSEGREGREERENVREGGRESEMRGWTHHMREGRV